MYLNQLLFLTFFGFQANANAQWFYPCGQDMKNFIKFEKYNIASHNMWKCEINLGFYSNLVKPTVVAISYVSPTYVYYKNWKTYISFIFMVPESDQSYLFNVMPSAGSTYPLVEDVTVNGYTVCNNSNYYRSITEAQSQATSAPDALPLTALNNNVTTSTTCGKRKRNYLNLITNSDESEPGQWPWHVAIYLLNNKYTNPMYHCGGSLVARNIVITVAHCVVKRNYELEARRLHVYAGVTDLNNLNCNECQNSDVTHIIKHPYFSPISNHADIAIVRLRYCLFLTDYVQTVCLSATPAKGSFVGYYGTVVGFGRTENETLSDVLRQAEIQIQTDATCNAYDMPFYLTVLNEFNFCAGNGPFSNVSPCNGDSGGGLVLPTKTDDGSVFWSLQGLVSTTRPKPGTNICDPQAYVLYTDISAYFSWITRTIGMQMKFIVTETIASFG